MNYRGKRPFYAIIIADAAIIERLAQDKKLGTDAAANSYRFNQPTKQTDYCVIPGWTTDKGRYRVTRDRANAGHAIEQCEGDPTGCLAFSIAANLAPLGKSDAFLCDSTNYRLTAQGSYSLSISKIEPGYDNRYKSYLDGKTHIITVIGKMESQIDDMGITLSNDFPAWAEKSSASSDLSASAPGFSTTTLGLSHFLRGIYDAQQSAGSPLTTLTIKLEK